MPKKATKAADSPFYQARISCASCSDRMGSRESASEELGIDRTRLARIELGTLIPYPEEVVMMAEGYNAPELMNYYCSALCPVGKLTICPCELQNIDRLTIRIISALSEATVIRESILAIAEDGEVTDDEQDKLGRVVDLLDQITAATESLKLWVRKYAK